MSTSTFGATYNEFSYSVSGTNVTITGLTGPRLTITIPSSIPGVGTVTSIGFQAFYNYTSLTNVTIPKSVINIGYSAFAGCTNLTGAYFQGNAPTSFGSWVFNSTASGFRIYFVGTAKGWSTPQWNGYLAQPDTRVGSVEVNIIPAGAVNAGAQWQVDGSAWQTNGAMVSGLAVGDHTVSFSAVDDRITPSSQVVTINADATATTTGIYYPSGDFSYSYDGTNVTITGYWGAGGEVTIPSSIPEFGVVTTIGDSAFKNSTNLTSVIIPTSVTKIGVSAFLGCTNLTKISIPTSVVSIGAGGFNNCQRLASVALPNSITSIPDFTFYGCASLTNFTIPNSVNSIGMYAFSGCTHLAGITIPGNVTNIGNYAFSGCNLGSARFQGNAPTVFSSVAFPINFLILYPVGATGWTQGRWNGYTAEPYYMDFMCHVYGTYVSIYKYIGPGGAVTIPSLIPGFEPVTAVEINAFNFCTNLTSVIIPDSITNINDNAFSGCNHLTNAELPSSIMYLGRQAFSGCVSLTSITIPDGVAMIGATPFFGCTNLASVTIPNGWNPANYGLTNLTTVVIPSGVTNVGDFAFLGVSKLNAIVADPGNTDYSSLNGVLFNKSQSLLIQYPIGLNGSTYAIPDGVAAIGASAFSNCTSLASVAIPASVTNIGNSAFARCTGLTGLTIPGSVVSVGESAFHGCTNLTDVIISTGVARIGNSAFSGCAALGGIIIPDGIIEIGQNAFSFCTGLKNIVIPSSITNIGGMAFRGCTNLKTITVDPNNTVYSSVNGVLFDKNQSLLIECPAGFVGGFSIPKSVVRIGEYAFNGCSGLSSVVMANGVSSIGEGAFYNCINLSISIPGSVTNIGVVAFLGCASLKNIVIPNGVTSIEDDVFNGCVGLTNISIPGSVTNIGVFAFGDCTSLKDISIPNRLTSLGFGAFCGCAGLTSITIPGSITNIGGYAFAYCSSLAQVYSQGNGPSSVGDYVFSHVGSGFVFYYPSTATGWDSFNWHRYPGDPWISMQPYYYLAPEERPVVSLTRSLGAVALSLDRLQLGTNYQLQISTDLKNWSNSGPAFIATNATQAFSEFFDVTNVTGLFFQLHSAPIGM